MPLAALITARDWSLILLALEALLILAVPLVIFYQLNKALRKFVPKVVPALRMAQGKLTEITATVQRVLATIAAPFIWASSTVAGVSAAMTGLRRNWPWRR